MIGQIISHYKIIEKIGEGGMGVVYKAEDTKLKRVVALKFLPRTLTRNEEARERFMLEAQAAAKLNNPNIVTIHEINDYSGDIYIAMEYVEGETIREKLPPSEIHDTPLEAVDDYKARKMPPLTLTQSRRSPLQIKQIVDIAIQVCQGLQAAHKLGIVHRDIKPQNLIINQEGVTKILDFGVAKLTRGTKVTKEYATLGTVHYMSPDQLTGNEIDQRTDIWSLGVVLYEMLTAELPFKHDGMQAIMYAIVNDNPIPPSELRDDVSRELERIILKCLRKDRDNRYHSVEPLLVDLKKVLKSIHKDSQALRLKKKEVRKETERRQATVIFAEIYGYREMLEKFDAEEAASNMNVCFEMFAAAIEKYGGKIDKIMESSLTALFGVPAAIEEAPKQAVNAAIEMRNCLQRFDQESNLKIPLDIRIGINSGMVIAGAIGKDKTKDYTVMGDTITLSSQLKDLSTKGQIYVGQLTYKNTRNYFEYKRLKPFTFKGQTKQIDVFELLSTKEKMHRPKFGSESMIHSEMVGRDKESNKLELFVMKTINGEGAIISVLGEAGMGKSRLLAELKNKDLLKKVMLLEGRALSIGKNLSYHPIINVFKNWANITEEDTEIESISKLETAVSNIYPRGAGEVFPFVATMMGMKLNGKYAERLQGIEVDSMEKLILKNMRELMSKMSEHQPVVFIIEDLHWADMSSIELCESLFRLAEQQRILFIIVLRPGYQETGERILETIKERYESFYSEIHLLPLDGKLCETLVRNLVKISILPADIKSAIISRAEGNPFFIEEVVRTFIDTGVLEHKDGKFKVSKKIDSVVIPETIHDVLMARIDRLDEVTKTLLKEASVIGRYFFYKVLTQVAKHTDYIDEQLDYLKAIQLIRERTRMEEIEYHFKDAMVHEVAYESILLKKRKELHLKVANAIESVFSGRLHEFYGMLALHYSRGENLEKAGEYLIKAGEEALKAAASYEALSYYQDALKLYQNKYVDAADSEKIAALEIKIALALHNKGNYVEAVKHFDKVFEYWRLERPKVKIVSLFFFVIDFLGILKNLYLPSGKAKKNPTKRDSDILEISSQRGTALASVDTYRLVMDSIRFLRTLFKYDLAKVRNGISFFSSSSGLFIFSGKFIGVSRKLLDYARDFIEPGDKKNIFTYNSYEMLFNLLTGKWNKELEYDEEMVNSNLQEGELFITPNYLLFGGMLKAEQGDFNAVRLFIDKLHEFGETYENDYSRGLRYILSTRQLLLSRNLAEALSDIEIGISVSKRINQILDVLIFTGMKANIRILQGDIAGAKKSLQEAKEIILQEKEVVPWYINTYHLSRFLFDVYHLERSLYAGEKSTVSQYGKKALRSGKDAVKTAAKYAPIQVETYKLMGIHYWLTGNRDKAISWWDKSIKTAEHLGARVELSRTYMEVGRRLSEKESKFNELNGIRAEQYLEMARALFKEMGLDRDLDEFEKIRD